ncbi:MAG: GGDEF domain-containing protein [Erysipelotrichales bacterium]|nr:GGDEF domain-containing protein [Erysipelotrichales bacterium]
MGKKIAVALSAINMDNQKKILEGLTLAAKEIGVNLFVFTNYVGMRDTEESVAGAYSLFELPDFKEFDGAIVVMNTIHYPPASKHLLTALKEANIPCVSIDREIEGMSCVKTSSYDAEMEVMEHMILEHGQRNIHYISGPVTLSQEAAVRLQAYKDALTKHNIPVEESHIYNGFFNMQSGREAVQHFIDNGEDLKCIICGNDATALGAMEVLQKKGYRIPEDVKIVGFDNGESSLINIPPLATVDKNQHEVGRKALQEVLALIDGKEYETHVIPCTFENRGSCGCDRESTIDVPLLKAKYNSYQLTTETMTDINRHMSSELANVKSVDSIIEILKKYILVTPTSSFYLCLCDNDKVFRMPEKNLGTNIDIMQVNTTYTDEIYIPLAYEDGEFTSYGKFSKGLVLPKECTEKASGKVYIITPVFYQKCYYGYWISSNVGEIAETSLYYSLIMSLAVSLENTRRWLLLEDAVIKLNNVWSYDMLTKLYNRAGFYNESKGFLEEMIKIDGKVFIVFFDLDGLKKINDAMGHEAGDTLIQLMADCIRVNISDNMLAMRYGGDEFVVFGSYQNGQEVTEFVENVLASIKKINDSKMYSFTLSTSVGGSKYRAREIEDLSVLIDIADQNMYEEKRRKKAKMIQEILE